MLFPISALFSLLCFLTLVDAAVISTRNQEISTSLVLPDSGHGQCKELLQRKEWRTLTNIEKKNYIDAVKCLMERPAQKPVFPEAQSRFDEFQAYHMYIADKVHAVGQFLPWHRHYLRRYELALQTECGYKGAAPYWDWAQDSDDGAGLHTSPVWDPKTGFGGSGVPGTYSLPAGANFTTNRIFPESFIGCVQDGPFANHILHLGPGQLRTTHCLVRGLNETTKLFLNSKAVARTQSQPTFEQFRIELEGEPITTDHRQHDGGHDMIGGDMSNFYSSPGEPLFYLHHANLDRIWWQWQQMLPSRLDEISGRSTTTPPFKNVTLDFILQMDNLGPSIPIRDVMNIHSAPNCYTYV